MRAREGLFRGLPALILAGALALAGCTGNGGTTIDNIDGRTMGGDADVGTPDGVEPDLVGVDTIYPDLVGPDLVEPDLVEPDLVEPDLVEPDLVEPDLVEPDLVEPDVVEVECETDEDCLAALGEEIGPCQLVYCHAASGKCVQKDAPDGQPCDAGDLCVKDAVCNDGECAGKAVLCDDGNPCTDDSCNPEEGCESVNNEAECDDGNPCTSEDKCAEGTCVGAGNECPCESDDDCFEKEDGNLCNGFLVCVEGSCVVDAETIVTCEPTANPCVSVACQPATGECVEKPAAQGEPCDDMDVCTLNDACQAGVCKGTKELQCNDQNPCTADSCDAATGCVFEPTEGLCDDGDPCTKDDICVDGVCEGEPGVACDCTADEECVDLEDGNLCNGTLICVAGKCVLDPDTEIVCETPEEDSCNVYECVAETGDCEAVPVEDGTLCDDEDPCSLDSECQEGACVGVTMDTCDDGNPCTMDECITNEGCTHEAQEADCDDGDACTENDTCTEGLCGGTPVDCDDDNPCTDDACDTVAGCVYTNNVEPCDDGSVCSTVDVCQDGQCTGAEFLDCKDENPCTHGECDAETGCYSVASEGECDDGDLCTVDDFCGEGECQPGKALECDDNNPCTDDSCVPDQGCVFTPNTLECDDGDACTSGDTCAEGQCMGGDAVVCDDQNPCTDDSCDPATGCVYVNNSEECDDANACTTGDTCLNGECVGPETVLCQDENPCTDDSCDPATGCVFENNEASCDDNDVCTVEDMCAQGQCVSGEPMDCDDNNPCTEDACDIETGCIHQDLEGACEDGNACTTGDLCQNGVCVGGEAVDCNDDNPCTSDACDPLEGCVNTNNTLACDDGNACTLDDACAEGICIGAAVVCDDKNPCTDDSCDPEIGCVFTPNTAPCDDNSLCTENDQCEGGVCQPGTPLDCDDDNECTSDTCIPTFGCVSANNNNSCEDGNLCTTGDKCSGGQCVGGTPVECDDGNTCTEDSCDPELGCVAKGYPDGTQCNDGNDCTDNDICVEGVCKGEGLQCDDGNPCTDNKCIVGYGCVYPYNTLPCDDGNVCTLEDVCSNGQCVGAKPLDCDDGNPCTNDLCDSKEGCVYVNNTSPCDDQNACTEGDTCKAGVCIGGAPITCEDGNLCTDDSCNPALGCVFTDNNVPCDDGNPCTVKDHCEAGECVGGGDLNCDDENPCTNDACVPQLGCVHSYNTDPCSDGNACTDGDVCVKGICKPGGPLDCDDDNICTTDSCSPLTGCKYVNNSLLCNDGDLCTVKDQCKLGECVGLAKVCNDNNVCTLDSCDPVTGQCVFTPVANGTKCDDSDVCTEADVCTDGVCGGSDVDCDDGNPCTADSCINPVGCVHKVLPNGTVCDDDDLCTTTDVCQSGTCTGKEVLCDDYNPCTSDFCDPATGECVYEVNQECDELAVPQYDTAPCNGTTFAFTPAVQNVKWAFDSTPGTPAPLTGNCSLNFNNGTDYAGSPTGNAVSTFWYDATAVTGDMTLAFHSYNGTDPTENNNNFDKRYVEASVDGFNTVAWSATLNQDANKGEWVIETFDLADLAGQKFQLRFRFDAVDSEYNAGPGWFVEEINVYPGPVVVPAGDAPYSEEFEPGNVNGWQFFGGKAAVAWAIDATAADPGKFAGETSLNFNDGVDFAPTGGGSVAGNALSPVIDLTALPAGTEVSLVYRSWHETETLEQYDRRYVQASALAFGTDLVSKQESNAVAQKGWKIQSLDLSAFVGTKFRIRYRFDTIDGAANQYKGWFVDNATVATAPVPVYADGVVCSSDVWTYNNSTPPVIWDVDALPADPGYYSPDCSLNFNNNTDIELQGQKVTGTATSTAFVATAPTEPAQKLYLTFRSYLNVETGTNFDVTTVSVVDTANPANKVTYKLPKGTDLNKWVAQQVDISALHGKKVQVVFSFDSVDSIANAGYKGVFIDDVMVQGK